MIEDRLLTEILRDLWEAVEKQNITSEQYLHEQQRLVDGYRQIWTRALLVEGFDNLRHSLLSELSAYLGCDLAEVERRCRFGSKEVENEWHTRVGEKNDGATVERFYDQTQAYLCDLIWWHATVEDDDPLSYVMALRFAQRERCRRHLDFGAGISSGSILFRAHGFDVVSADISSSLQRFSQWRFATRDMAGQFIDLREAEIPSNTFDFITAMDVFEHLVDPVREVDRVADALVPGGFIYGRFSLEPNDHRPQHIVRDFEPVYCSFPGARACEGMGGRLLVGA